MAPRLAILIVLSLLLLAGCLAVPPGQAAATNVCRSCHEPHRTDLGTCVDCHRGNPSTARKDLAHDHLLTSAAAWHGFGASRAVASGRRLVDRAACRRCHRIAGEGNPLATDLDRAVWNRSQEELRRALEAPAEQMPRFGVAADQADDTIAYLLNVARGARDPGPYRVHFTRSDVGATGGFETHCGRCHRALTPEGALGAASGGANLSGLLTPYYPRTATGDLPWSEAALRAWVRNPRAARPAALMPPLRLDDREFSEVLRQLRGTPK